MKRQSVLSRRQFLQGSLGTSLVFGFQLASCQHLNVRSVTSVNGFSPSVFLRIEPDNSVMITIPRSEMGQGVRTALAMIVAEELDADWTMVKVAQAPAGYEYGSQFTGGSSSISTFWQPLRQVGAMTRAVLITAAAQRWGVEAKSCLTESGEVIHPDGKQRIAYGELTEIARQVPLPDPESLTLKDPKDFWIVGQPLGQVFNSQILDGSAVFGLDVKVPNMLYATIARCPVFDGKLVEVEVSEAKRVAGVQDVIELENAVAVVAEHTWAAIQGRQKLNITWDEGDNIRINSDNIRQDVLAQLSETVVTTFENNRSAKASDKLEALYEIPYLAHAPMEPMNCVADVGWTGCEVWAPTQNPQQAMSELPLGRPIRVLSRWLGAPSDVINNVNVTLMGGGFGRRLEVDYVNEAVQVSQAVGAPVQVVWTREDDIRHDYFHPLSYHYLSADLDPLAEIEQQTFNGPSNIPTGPWRSVENFTQAFVRESFVDELAVALDRDPYELRMERIKESRLKAVLELAASNGNWGSPVAEGWGRGIASYSTWGATHCAEVVDVSIADNGQVRVHRVVCAVDCGLVINPDMVKAQMEGGIVYALSAALKSNITIANGQVQQSNFHDYPILRFDEMPVVEVYIVPSSEPPTGVGETSGPPLTPAVANAVFAATGKRIRRIPMRAEDLRTT